MSLVKVENISSNGIKKIGLVTALFNRPVTEKLEIGALEKLKELGFEDTQVIQLQVPGAYEIPLAAKALFEQGCEGVIAIGAVIRGDTAHFDFVCNGVERGCMDLQMELGKPIGFGVITTENAEQAYDRAGGKKGNKGAEAAEVTVEMIQLISKLTH